MYHWVHEFGLGGRTGIELPGENTGMMLPRERWDVINSSVSVSIGHEMSVTPLANGRGPCRGCQPRGMDDPARGVAPARVR